MTWTDEQQQHLKEAYGAAFASDPGGVAAGVIAVADLAVSLFLARASAQVREDERKVRAVLDNVHAGVMTSGLMAADARDAHARVSALAQEAESLRAKVAELDGRREQDAQVIAIAQRALEKAQSERDGLRAEVERLTARVGELDRDSADAMDNWRLAQRRETEERVARKAAESRHPCSPTCTHDDAAKPGHAERVKERSEAVEEIGRHPENDADTFEAIENGVEGTVPYTRTQIENYAERKAEAMRAACLQAVRAWAQREGYDNTRIIGKVLAAIEGATP